MSCHAARAALAYLAASVLVLIPCFWQSRLQAGDLGSHIYNAGLAQRIRQAKLPGVELPGGIEWVTEQRRTPGLGRPPQASACVG